MRSRRRPASCKSLSVMHGVEPHCRRATVAAQSAAAAGLAAHIHGWLLLLPAAVLLVDLHVLSGCRHAHRQLLLDPERPARRGLRRPGQLSNHARRPGVLARAAKQHRLCGERHPANHRAVLAMALWVNGKIAGRPFLRLSFFTPDRTADDRGRQYLAVLLRAGLRPARPDTRAVRH